MLQNLKSPSTKIYLKDEYSNINQSKADFVKNKLEFTILKDIVKKSEIYFDPSNTNFETEVSDDKEMLSIYKEFISLNDNVDDCLTSPWIIRMIFDKETMMEKSIIRPFCPVCGEPINYSIGNNMHPVTYCASCAKEK